MMATFPDVIDDLGTARVGERIYASVDNQMRRAIEAVETSVGVTGSDDTTSLRYQIAQLMLSTGTSYYAEANGVLADGNDHSLAFQALLNSMTLGGVVRFGPGEFVFAGQIVFPNDGSLPIPSQKNIVIEGCGGLTSGQLTTTELGGTVLKFSVAPATGKILTLGQGSLTLKDLTISSRGASTSGPFIWTTNTSLHLDRVGFFGRQSTPASCDEDAIILGGPSTDGEAHDGTSGDAFQGYGTTITNCTFARMRRAVTLDTYANAVIFMNNWIRHDSGGDYIVYISPHYSQSNTGNVFANNQFEMIGYSHVAYVGRGLCNHFVHNSIWDLPYTDLTGVSFDSSTHRLTKTGAFASYNWTSGDTIYLTGNTANTITAGLYTISSKYSNDAVVLSTDPITGSVSDIAAKFYQSKNCLYNLDTSNAVGTYIIDAMMTSPYIPIVNPGAQYRRDAASADELQRSRNFYPQYWLNNSRGAYKFTAGIGPAVWDDTYKRGFDTQCYVNGVTRKFSWQLYDPLNSSGIKDGSLLSLSRQGGGIWALQFEADGVNGTGCYTAGDIISPYKLRLYSSGSSNIELGSNYNEFVTTQTAKPLGIKSGPNTSTGTVALNGNTEVTVTTTAIATGDKVFFGSGPQAVADLAKFGVPIVTEITNGASFKVASTNALDNRTLQWWIMRPS